MQKRLKTLRNQFDRLTIDAFLITNIPHLRYFSDFSGSAGVGIVTRQAGYFITDGRYATQVRREVRGWTTFISADGPFEEIARRRLLRKGLRIGFDGNSVPFATYKSLQKQFPGVKFLPKPDTLEAISAIKDESEIRKIKSAVRITDQVFQEILTLLRPGVSELDIASEITYRQRQHGAERDAFEVIVASGVRGALPHGRASAKKIKRGEFVILDFGCVVDGYHSDLTRTVAVGKPSQELRTIYQTVYDAQRKAVDAAQDGITAKELDAIARTHIDNNGYGAYFIHSLGHGLGLQIHEPPRISKLSRATLVAGNVVTIEPGIYVPGVGGVRIEDDIVVRSGSRDVLNRAPRELIIL